MAANKQPESSEQSAAVKKKKKKQGDGTRETVESIAIAFVLAFLFKTFQAEAYVIPTGSMAPTLFGRHKEITCEGCGFQFELGASSEIDQNSGVLTQRIKEAECSNCGRKNDVEDAPVFNGDRILVNKQILEFKRFDVVVFKNPEQGHVNYIKRLVGLPGETLRIRKGDLWVKAPGGNEFEIQRKEPLVQKDIQLTVHDDKYVPTELIEQGWPERWAPSVASSDDGSVGGWLASDNAWEADYNSRIYAVDAPSGDVQWLRYRHFQPPPKAWYGPQFMDEPSASLVADFCSFNAYGATHLSRGFEGPIYWVGDLTLNANVSINSVSAGAKLILELVEGPSVFQCAVDLTTGEAQLVQRMAADMDDITVIGKASTDVKESGDYEIAFANVDDRLCLFIDGNVAEFDTSTEYEAIDVPQPTDRDLAPCGIAAANASLTVSDLLIERDIYYRNDIIKFDGTDGVTPAPYEMMPNSYEEVSSERVLQASLSDPSSWTKMYADMSAVQLERYGKYGEYQLADDEYLMFGDNSSMSKDSRLFDYYSRPMNGVFSHRYAVREQDLIGKALYIFWPHGIPFLNDGEGIAVRNHSGSKALKADEYPSIRLPFYPDIGRMKKIR